MNKSKKILIVEDESSLYVAVFEKLRMEGYQVTGARNGSDGLRIALEQRPDLILLDIVLPEMDGITMLKQLRKDEWGKGVPVVLLTNLNEAQANEKGLDESAQDYLVKADWTLEEVIERVGVVLA